MHNQWLDLIPYYIAGTVSRSKAAALEQHLARCESCRQAVKEWRQVAGIVRSEAHTWAGQTPALGQDMRARLSQVWGPSSNGHGHPVSAVIDQTQMIRQNPRRAAQPQIGRLAIPVTLAAALMGVVMIGLLLLYITMREGESPEQHLSAGVGTGTLSFSAQTVTPTRTPFLTPARTQSGLPTAAAVADLGIIPPRATATPPRFMPSVTPFRFLPTPTPISPPTDYFIPTPTAIYDYAWGYDYLLITLEQVGSVPAGTRVRVSATWYDGVQRWYSVVSQGEQLFADVRESQLAYAGPGPGPTPTPIPPLIILSFTADQATAQAGQWLTLSWNVTGVQFVKLMEYNLIAPAYSSVLQDNLPAVSSLTISVPMPDSYAQTDSRAYQLIGVDYYGHELVGATENGGIITLPLACPFSYFFGSAPNSCPEYPMPDQGSGSFQPFEGGFMIGMPIASGTNVYVLYTDGSWISMVASNTLPDVIETPPDGRYQPFGAFGMAWNSSDVRARLGWATAAASNYTYLSQSEARNYHTEKTAIKFYLSLPDGRAIYIVPQTMVSPEYGTWTYQ